ncbi:DUF1289 domain-containing protein [Pseudosulfitobacter koreensis]|uniref:DUF1289 domain-containing protein n=1 Tax=Pseudosulfitobacter koreensis TaxID=2968472 RepID=A0ABT1Z2Z9_9RHOB|nr:DUF1289 domain-containing protein [Pseudosulfitobacter koreense]MCR8827510.1 DUF1289 domain-containing protein [Pseudosulfitobacter koreense]
MPKLPSPCIDVCKYKREGHCIACSMTKPQKKAFKSLKKEDQRHGFVQLVMAQQAQMGKFKAWPAVYEKKCRNKGVTVPLLPEG